MLQTSYMALYLPRILNRLLVKGACIQAGLPAPSFPNIPPSPPHLSLFSASTTLSQQSPRSFASDSATPPESSPESQNSDDSTANTSNGSEELSEGSPKSFDAEDVDYYRRNRFRDFYRQVLFREMMLKTSPTRWKRTPKLNKIEVSIAIDENINRVSGKKKAFLFALALEQLTGIPAEYKKEAIAGRADARQADEFTHVTAELSSEEMKYEFLEKLVNLGLPNQARYITASPARRAPKPKPVMGPSPFYHPVPNVPNLPIIKPYMPHYTPWELQKISETHFIHLEVDTMLAFPDFQENYLLFENMKGFKVKFTVTSATTPRHAELLLQGFHIPMVISPSKKMKEAKALALRLSQDSKGPMMVTQG